MRARATIRKFLFSRLLITFTATILLTVVGSYYISHQRIQDHLDEVLVELGFIFKASTPVESLTPAALQKVRSQIQQEIFFTQKIPAQTQRRLLNNLKQLHRYQFQLWNRQGRLLAHSALVSKMPFIGTPGLGDQHTANQQWRVFTMPDEKQALIFVVAENYAFRHALIREIIVDDLYLSLFVYLPSGLFIWLIIGRGLKKMRGLASNIAQRVTDNLEPVDLKAVPVEVMPLIDQLNKLFLRVKQAYDREQRFAADAAHELHTPLAALRTQAQVALKTIDYKERFIQLQHIIASVDRCTHIIQQLLILCRLSPETAISDHFSQVDLSNLAAEVVAQLAPSAIDKQIDIELIADPTVRTLHGNATGLYAMARNLIDNAIRYTPVGGTIKVFVQSQTNAMLFRVVDNGPGIPEELHKRIFERFYRVLGTNVQGSGLGLAIVKETVKHHKGTITLNQPPGGQGLSVTILLPCS